MKKEIMKKKLDNLQNEIRMAKIEADEFTKDYLCNLESKIEEYKNKLDLNEMESSDGGTLGFRRAILEYNDLANIDSLYEAAMDIDKFYSEECKKW